MSPNCVLVDGVTDWEGNGLVSHCEWVQPLPSGFDSRPRLQPLRRYLYYTNRYGLVNPSSINFWLVSQVTYSAIDNA